MEANVQTNDTQGKKPFPLSDAWFLSKGRRRLILFLGGLTAWGILLAVVAWLFNHHPHPVYPDARASVACWGAIGSTILFCIAWPLVCFKFKKRKLDLRRISPGKLTMWWVITIWLTLFAARATEAQVTNAPPSTAAVQQVVSPAQMNASPNATTCGIWIFLFILFLGGLFIYFLWRICQAAGLCGHGNNQPPQAPPDNGNNIVMGKNQTCAYLANDSVALPSISYTLSGGTIVSNSAGLPMKNMSLPMLVLSGANLPNGGAIGPSPMGVTTPPSIGLWQEDTPVADATLDPSHPYVLIYNFTLLGSTNLTQWQEICTTIGWANNNISVPLLCTVTYTNGQPAATNWTQFFLDNTYMPTNIVVYGAQAPLVANPNIQFYKLTANTNAIVTSWP